MLTLRVTGLRANEAVSSPHWAGLYGSEADLAELDPTVVLELTAPDSPLARCTHTGCI